MNSNDIMIRCPHCGGDLTLDALNPLAAKVRDDEFRKALDDAMASEREETARVISGLRHDLEVKDGTIGYLRDMRLKLSTKMLGESLEQHCESEFNKIRAMAFPRAEFGKDNDASSGSKGDYIFRECDQGGVEIVSIMFEMKNESQDTRVRHKNSDFFKELDKDRKQKGCEYAVLVSMLEPDNDFYNAGIADVGYEYPKMFVVRPQCFLAIIGLLRNAGLQSLQYRREMLDLMARQSDFDAVEGRIEAFKQAFGKNCETGLGKLHDGIDALSKEISRLEKIKEQLEMAERQFQQAAKKSDGLTARKMLGKAREERHDPI